LEEYTKAGMIISPCSQWQADYSAARRRCNAAPAWSNAETWNWDL